MPHAANKHWMGWLMGRIRRQSARAPLKAQRRKPTSSRSDPVMRREGEVDTDAPHAIRLKINQLHTDDSPREAVRCGRIIERMDRIAFGPPEQVAPTTVPPTPLIPDVRCGSTIAAK